MISEIIIRFRFRQLETRFWCPTSQRSNSCWLHLKYYSYNWYIYIYAWYIENNKPESVDLCQGKKTSASVLRVVLKGVSDLETVFRKRYFSSTTILYCRMWNRTKNFKRYFDRWTCRWRRLWNFGRHWIWIIIINSGILSVKAGLKSDRYQCKFWSVVSTIFLKALWRDPARTIIEYSELYLDGILQFYLTKEIRFSSNSWVVAMPLLNKFSVLHYLYFL